VLDLESVAMAVAGLRAWLCSGGCQSPNGAFVAWLDTATGRRAYDYPEITGYALTFLAGLATLSAADRATGYRAGNWLVERLRSGNLAARDGWDNNAVYLFDLGMIATGLLAYGRRTGTAEYVESGRELARYLAQEVAVDGSFAAVARTGPPSERDCWSTRGVPHLAKLSQAFLLAGDAATPAPLIEEVKRAQLPDGRILTHPEQDEVMLHPHLYAAEGLWIWGSAVGDVEALECARRAVDWVWTLQLDEGGLPRSDAEDSPEQCDVTAQAVRLALVVGLRSTAVDRAVARLIELARSPGDGLGMPYCTNGDSESDHLNTWASLFSAQALALAVPGARPIAWTELV
jgi:hypothetical protein